MGGFFNYLSSYLPDEEEDFYTPGLGYWPSALRRGVGEAFAAPKRGIDWLSSRMSGIKDRVVPVEELAVSAIAPEVLPGDPQLPGPYQNLYNLGRGATRVGSRFGLDPLAYGLNLPGKAGAALGGYFGLEGVLGAKEQAQRALEAESLTEAIEPGVETLGSAAMAGMGIHALGKGIRGARGFEEPRLVENLETPRFEPLPDVAPRMEAPFEVLPEFAAAPKQRESQIGDLEISPRETFERRFENMTNEYLERIKDRASEILQDPGVKDIQIKVEELGGRSPAYFDEKLNTIFIDPRKIQGENVDTMADILTHEIAHRYSVHEFPGIAPEVVGETPSLATERFVRRPGAPQPPEELRTRGYSPIGEGKFAEVDPTLVEHFEDLIPERAKFSSSEHAFQTAMESLQNDPAIREVRDRYAQNQKRLQGEEFRRERGLPTFEEEGEVPPALAAPGVKGTGISEPADIFRKILQESKLTRFNKNTIIQELEAKNVPVPEELRSQIPELLDELKSRGWVNEKIAGTMTLQVEPPRRVQELGPKQPEEVTLDLEEALKKSIEQIPERKPAIETKPPAPVKPKSKAQQMQEQLSPEEIEVINNILGKEKLPTLKEKPVPEEVRLAQEAAMKGGGKKPPIKKPPVTIREPEGERPATPEEINPEHIKMIDKITKAQAQEEIANKKKAEQVKNLEKGFVNDVTDIPKTLKASFDISWPGRQGLFLLNRKAALLGMGRGSLSGIPFKGEEFHHKVRKDLESRSNAELYGKSGLNQFKYDPTETTAISQRSEEFASQLAEKVPGVKQSERMFLDMGNLARANMFDEFAAKFQRQGKTFENNPELYKGLAEYLNVLTLRKPLPEKLQQAGWILNKMFFSPMAVYSRFEQMNPHWYYKLPREMQKAALRDVGGTLGTITALLGATTYAANQAGIDDVEFNTDPAGTHFGRLKVGKTYYDLHGLTPMIRTFYRMVSGRKLTSKGEYALPGSIGYQFQEDLPEAPFGQTAFGELTRFVENKTAPIYQAGKGLFTGKDWYGKDYSFSKMLVDLFAPMSLESIGEAGMQYGAKEALKQTPELLGFSTYTEFPDERTSGRARNKKKKKKLTQPIY